jgi:hypothetical protein
MGARGYHEAGMKGRAMSGRKPAEPATAELIRGLEEQLLLPEVRKSAERIADFGNTIAPQNDIRVAVSHAIVRRHHQE